MAANSQCRQQHQTNCRQEWSKSKPRTLTKTSTLLPGPRNTWFTEVGFSGVEVTGRRGTCVGRDSEGSQDTRLALWLIAGAEGAPMEWIWNGGSLKPLQQCPQRLHLLLKAYGCSHTRSHNQVHGEGYGMGACAYFRCTIQ